MKKLLILVIVLMWTYSTGISQNTKSDSVLISVNDIRVCNIVFSEYEQVREELRIYTKITNISGNIILTSDTINENYKLQVSNLKNIIEANEKVTDLKLLDKDRKIKKVRNRANLTTGISILLLILLL